jgi:hypothetical protein
MRKAVHDHADIFSVNIFHSLLHRGVLFKTAAIDTPGGNALYL